MNTGVSTTPCASVRRPCRALPDVARSVNLIAAIPLLDGLRGSALQQHRITVAVEAITGGDRMRIRAPDDVVAGKRRDQHQQRGFRQVEIGEQPVDYAEAVTRRDE